MSQTKVAILRQFPDADSLLVDRFSIIWDEVVDFIIQKMLDYCDPHVGDLHINLREEMTLELAKLEFFIAEKVVADRLAGRQIELLDEGLEREACFNEKGMAKLNNTAQFAAEHVWLKKYNERWKPKTEAVIKKEASPKVAPTSKVAPPPRVEDNHFVPKSFIKCYWSENILISRFTKNENGGFTKDKPAFGQWGFGKNLYSDGLEKWFGLLEGDAARPLKMLLSVEPLNRPQRESLVGFIVIQRLRNPHFMDSLKLQMKPIVADGVGGGRESDPGYMRLVYETLFSNNEFYDKLAGPIYRNEWVVVRSKDSEFVLPDTCNIFGIYDGEQYVVMPITPKGCLVVLPFAAPEIRIVPHYIDADELLSRDISSILIANAKKEFLAGESFQCFSPTSDRPNNIMRRIIFSIAKIVSEKSAERPQGSCVIS
ncbi:MAG: DUF4238 domain-containing protein [Methylophilus sp.]|nr:DUF4238 domain-containing protein [Methylophilus sp.]